MIKIKDDRGGLTVEATLVFPLFIMFIIVFVYVMQSYYIYGNINTAMYSAAGQLSAQAYTSNSIGYSEIKSKIVDNLDSKTYKILCNGLKGVDIKSSYYDSDKDEIYLKSRYKINMPINILGRENYSLGNNIVVRGWTGNKDLITNKNFVYITKTGKVYHTDIKCTYLYVKKITITRDKIDEYRNEGGAKYYQCEECKDENKLKNVYITKYGTAYHNIKSCSVISRTIIPIDIHDLDGRDKCEKCCGR